MSAYLAIIRREPDGGYGVCFPDFPGCVSCGANLEEAKTMAREALMLHLAGMRDDGETIPRPSLDVVVAEKEATGEGEVVFIVME